MLFYIIAYDIPCNKRRKRVADLLEGYGMRVQLSVFECPLSKQQYQQLQARLKKLIKDTEDNIRFYPVSQHTLSQVETWGVGATVTQPATSIII